MLHIDLSSSDMTPALLGGSTPLWYVYHSAPYQDSINPGPSQEVLHMFPRFQKTTYQHVRERALRCVSCGNNKTHLLAAGSIKPNQARR